jgi:hypothetical protein
MRPVGSSRLFRLLPSCAALFGLRAAELRPVPPKSAWFVCKWFAPKQAKPPSAAVVEPGAWDEDTPAGPAGESGAIPQPTRSGNASDDKLARLLTSLRLQTLAMISSTSAAMRVGTAASMSVARRPRSLSCGQLVRREDRRGMANDRMRWARLRKLQAGSSARWCRTLRARRNRRSPGPRPADASASGQTATPPGSRAPR